MNAEEQGAAQPPDPEAAPPSCPACGSPVSPEDGFCEECGADLKVRRAAPPDPVSPPCPQCGGSGYTDGYCDRCGRLAPSPRDRIERDLGPVAGVSDRGLRHSRNEDAMAFAVLDAPAGSATSAIVVCDGVSTSTDPDRASQLGADTALEALLLGLRRGEPAMESAGAAIDAAQQAVTALAGEYPDRAAAPSCTIAVAVLEEGAVTVGWLGDSRVYWLAGDGAARRLTVDDTWAGQMIAEGAAAEEDAYRAPLAHAIVRWLGPDSPAGPAHLARFEPEGPGLVLVCSDGLWNYVWDAADLATLVAERQGPAAKAALLTEVALAAGGHDNITAVLAQYPPAGPSAAREPQGTQTNTVEAPRVPPAEGSEP